MTTGDCGLMILALCFVMASSSLTNMSTGMALLLIVMQSHREIKCGDVNCPTFNPDAIKEDVMYAHTEPLPFVPATWTTLNQSCGSLSSANRAVIFSRP